MIELIPVYAYISVLLPSVRPPEICLLNQQRREAERERGRRLTAHLTASVQ